MYQRTRVLHSLAMFSAFGPGGMLQQTTIVRRVGYPDPWSPACTAARPGFCFCVAYLDRSNPLLKEIDNVRKETLARVSGADRSAA